MADEPAPEITAQAVERAVNPATGAHSVRVRLRVEADGTPPCEWSIWVPNEDSFERAVDLARKELHRISSRIAEAAEQTPDPSSPSALAETAPARRRPDPPTNEGTGWA